MVKRLLVFLMVFSGSVVYSAHAAPSVEAPVVTTTTTTSTSTTAVPTTTTTTAAPTTTTTEAPGPDPYAEGFYNQGLAEDYYPNGDQLPQLEPISSTPDRETYRRQLVNSYHGADGVEDLLIQLDFIWQEWQMLRDTDGALLQYQWWDKQLQLHLTKWVAVTPPPGHEVTHQLTLDGWLIYMKVSRLLQECLSLHKWVSCERAWQTSTEGAELLDRAILAFPE